MMKLREILKNYSRAEDFNERQFSTGISGICDFRKVQGMYGSSTFVTYHGEKCENFVENQGSKF